MQLPHGLILVTVFCGKNLGVCCAEAWQESLQGFNVIVGLATASFPHSHPEETVIVSAAWMQCSLPILVLSCHNLSCTSAHFWVGSCPRSLISYLTGPCYRCLFPESPRPQSCARCSDAGVLGVVPGIVGCLQAMEAIKIAAGVGAPLSRKLLLLDALSGRMHTVKLRTRCVITLRTGWKNRNWMYLHVDQLPNRVCLVDESHMLACH